jgi:hypothetical protein
MMTANPLPAVYVAVLEKDGAKKRIKFVVQK